MWRVSLSESYTNILTYMTNMTTTTLKPFMH